MSFKNYLIMSVIVIFSFSVALINSKISGLPLLKKSINTKNKVNSEWINEVRYRLSDDIAIVDMCAMRSAISDTTYLIIDVRAPVSFEKGHLPNAISIPLDLDNPYVFSQSIEKIADNKKIIFYCDGEGCDESLNAATILESISSIKNLAVYPGGYNEWKNFSF